MNWTERNAWLLLAGVVALVAWGLTRWITHVNHVPASTITITFEQHPRFDLQDMPLTLLGIQRDVERFPVAALVGQSRLLLIPTSATKSIALSGGNAGDVTCKELVAENGAVATLLAESEASKNSAPVAVAHRDRFLLITVPRTLSSNSTNAERIGIQCDFARPQNSTRTFTERAITVRVDTRVSGAVLLDVSALENVDDLRFSGGLQVPVLGERARLLHGRDDILSAEWSDVSAQEQRDIILVIIGALSAIAAAMMIEAIRPSVKSRSKQP